MTPSALFYRAIGRSPILQFILNAVRIDLSYGRDDRDEFVTVNLPWAVAEKGYEALPLEVRVSGSCPIGGVGYAVMSGALPPPTAFSFHAAGIFFGFAAAQAMSLRAVTHPDGCGFRSNSSPGDGRSGNHGNAGENFIRMQGRREAT